MLSLSLKKVEQRVLLELTEEFIKQFVFLTVDSIENLCAKVRKNMERELKTAIRNRIKTQVLDSLIKENK